MERTAVRRRLSSPRLAWQLAPWSRLADGEVSPYLTETLRSVKIGSHWVHLRMCMECGKIGCCDDSPNRHASRHAHEVSHPIIRSAEPGEDWSWCYIDNTRSWSDDRART
jgi:Zn-finger in ubiquitin-hydrolases and other protein